MSEALHDIEHPSTVPDAAPAVPEEHTPAPEVAAQPPVNDHLSYWIDLFRWTAAFAVVLAHAGNRFVQATDTIAATDRTIVQTIYAFLNGFSHPGIMIFFVISGFLVGGTTWREAMRTGGIDIRRFMGRRLIRLWIVIVPALLATFTLDTWGSAQGDVAPIIYAEVRSHSLDAALCNVAFLQTVACDPYGTDGALWTLYNEFWYYLLFVAGVIIFVGKRYSIMQKAAFGMFILIVAAASFWQREGAPMVPYFAIWLLGAWAATVKRAPLKISPWLPLVGTLALLLGFRVGMGLKFWDNDGFWPFVFDLVSMGVFALFLATMRFRPVHLARFIAAPSVLLASFSFTLYCFHVPLMNAMAATMERNLAMGWRDVSHGLEWARLVVQLAFVMLFAFAVSRVTEARTDTYRRIFLRG
ncbi:acyltransferase family protein [Novosphingobium aquimarinum]|uniref:acyltransferase family protein n=1 Tax=Novosphingobium aquimarinum TaxID=2682494 RepID=UPI0012EB8742|nr:acyltransferase [Novosphingobium aquimarinum]